MKMAIKGNDAIGPDEIPISYLPRFREYGLDYQDGGSSQQLINYCPWCGIKLPESLRGAWFARVRALGLEPGDPNIPAEMLTSQWWEDEKL
jgi:hypothetical protein